MLKVFLYFVFNEAKIKVDCFSVLLKIYMVLAIAMLFASFTL